MKYLLLMVDDHTVELTAEEDSAAMEATRAWVKEMSARGVHLDGDRLRPPQEARTLKVRGGEQLVTDGPFAETKEQIAGYDILDCRDLEEALQVAAEHPFARFGVIEVRPFWPLPLEPSARAWRNRSHGIEEPRPLREATNSLGACGEPARAA